MSAVTDWPVGGSKAIHISFYKSIKTVLYHSKRGQTDRLEYGMRLRLHGNQAISHLTATSG